MPHLRFTRLPLSLRLEHDLAIHNSRVSLEETKKDLFSMANLKALGPDGKSQSSSTLYSSSLNGRWLDHVFINLCRNACFLLPVFKK